MVGPSKEIAGDWWARFVAGNGRVRLEELTEHFVPVKCVSGFSSHTLVHVLINMGGRMYVPYPTL